MPADKQQGITLNSLIHKEISLHIRWETKSWQAYSVAKLQEFKKKAKLKAIIYENKSIATPTVISPTPTSCNQPTQTREKTFTPDWHDLRCWISCRLTGNRHSSCAFIFVNLFHTTFAFALKIDYLCRRESGNTLSLFSYLHADRRVKSMKTACNMRQMTLQLASFHHAFWPQSARKVIQMARLSERKTPLFCIYPKNRTMGIKIQCHNFRKFLSVFLAAIPYEMRFLPTCTLSEICVSTDCNLLLQPAMFLPYILFFPQLSDS